MLAFQSEIDVIIAAIGDDEGGSTPHTFKSSSFPVAISCSYCGYSIWGLRKLGKTCKACGLSVHAQCELKLPAECTGSPGDYKAAGMESPALTPSQVTQPCVDGIIEASARENETLVREPLCSAVVIYDFFATSSFGLNISEGTTVHVLEEDDGSGWVKVADNHGGKGFVPASYLAISKVGSSDLSEMKGAEQGSATSNGQFAQVLYDYQAQGPHELTIVEGEVLELSSGPCGGQNYAETWWEGHSSDRKKGIFPSNYVKIV